MVVSLIGARLSPKIAPDTMAPAIKAGLPPKITPAGKKMGNAVNMVPMELPVAVATIQVAKNVNATNKPPFIPMLLASHTKPLDRPLAFIRALNIPITKKITITETLVMEEIPLIAASQN